MNLKQLRENTVGTVVQLLPKPLYNGKPIKSEHNAWLVVEELEDKIFLFQNRNTRHEISLGADNIQEFRTPKLLILRGQISLLEGKKTEFEPSAPGLTEEEGLEKLIEGSHWGNTRSVYEALKGYEGKLVTLRFPEKGDWKFGSEEVILERCTQHYVTLRREPLEIKFPKWLEALPSPVPKAPRGSIPEKKASVPLKHVSIAEDVENDRPLLMFDYTFWDET